MAVILDFCSLLFMLAIYVKSIRQSNVLDRPMVGVWCR